MLPQMSMIHPARELVQLHPVTRSRVDQHFDMPVNIDLQGVLVHSTWSRVVFAEVEDKPLADDREKGICNPAASVLASDPQKDEFAHTT